MPSLEAPDEPRRYSDQAHRIFRMDRAAPVILEFGEPVARGRGDGGAALHAAQAALAHASRVATLAEMSATIAHEVNQPLAAIVMGAEAGLRWLSRDDMDVSRVEQLLRRIVSNARRASDIVQRIRNMATKDEPELGPIDLND